MSCLMHKTGGKTSLEKATFWFLDLPYFLSFFTLKHIRIFIRMWSSVEVRILLPTAIPCPFMNCLKNSSQEP